MLHITDMEKYKTYIAPTSALVAEYGGTFIIRGAEQCLKENTPPYELLIVIEFESLDQANAFYNDERYKEVLKVIQQNSDRFVFNIENFAE